MGPEEHRLRRLLLAWAAAGLALGLALHWPAPEVAWVAFAGATLPVLAVLLRDIAHGLRGGNVGLDILAALSMAGALALGETLAGAVVALMFAGGSFLEAYARQRARREMTALLSRQPRRAARHGATGLEEVPIEALRPGDRVLVRQGEVVPVDGRALGPAVLDTSTLTGESIPVTLAAGDPVLSGASNAGEAFDLEAEREAAASTLAGIIRLVEQAQASRPPMARLADRWALGFLGVTLAIAAAAWLAAGTPHRALAVLVVATPCPLILAVPVALIAGLSRAARAGVLVKSGAALETLARVRVLLLDKTGTLTEGRVRLLEARPGAGLAKEELLRLAASLDQASAHPVAAGLVEAARQAGLALAVPEEVREVAGAGISGRVGGHAVALGGPGFVAAHGWAEGPADGHPPGAVRVCVAVDGAPGGTLVLADPLRADAAAMLATARAAGIRRIVLLSGDRAAVAEPLGALLGLDAVLAERSPAGKVEAVLREKPGGPVLMLGDGVNDAPALAAADIGVAMGARGALASAEAADAVILVDRIDRVAEAMRIARRARGIALQSVAAGIGLSVLGMLAAAAGHLSPVQGAVVQEAIDVAVILNALRALRG
ncbi:heavy metal translocating P-type ATPase [Roseicella aquatilis]|uniref:P-type Zn(2+) transporter n=1 Tax=Roseicella aquatilis TaxID=2527868 RepID=A0A4R4DUN5_9PROT|nr:heavy metal translocating P-type ATPase [Roseicella aquatilis]TCZ66827.1 heavy metal translocating P-type ATPase [Roseicella aquatilis]